jgi:uncharacterized membrane protein YfcA
MGAGALSARIVSEGGTVMDLNWLVFLIGGVAVGIGASFSGLGGGFLMVPLMLFLGFSAQKAVGTSFLGILVISLSALAAHSRLANVDYRLGLLLGIGGAIGAQVGANLVEHVSTEHFKKIFSLIMVGLAVYLFFKK